MCGCSGTPDWIVYTVIIINSKDSCSNRFTYRGPVRDLSKYVKERRRHTFQAGDNGAAGNILFEQMLVKVMMSSDLQDS